MMTDSLTTDSHHIFSFIVFKFPYQTNLNTDTIYLYCTRRTLYNFTYIIPLYYGYGYVLFSHHTSYIYSWHMEIISTVDNEDITRDGVDDVHYNPGGL